MNNMDEVEQQHLQNAMAYFNDAPAWVWNNPIVIRSVRHGRWWDAGVTTGYDGLPIQGLVQWKLDGYEFKYKGISCVLQ